MPTHEKVWVSLDEQGRVVLPVEAMQHLGYQPGDRIQVDLSSNTLHLNRPLSHLAKIYIEPTTRCNLACRMCLRNTWTEPNGDMAQETFSAILADLERLKSKPDVFFGGFGEPLVHPRIVEMVARLTAIGCSVELITNGLLLTRQLATRLIEAGLGGLWVSLDGAWPESYADVRLGSALQNVVENVSTYYALFRQMRKQEPLIGAVFVAMQRNIADLPLLARMSNRMGISRILVSNVLPYGPDMCAERLYLRVAGTSFSKPSTWVPSIAIPRMDFDPQTSDILFSLLRNQPGAQLNGGWNNLQNRCPFVDRGSTTIAWDGGLSPCLPLMHDQTSYLFDLERRLSRYTFGNVRTDGLTALWESVPYVAFRERVKDFDFSPCTQCASCQMAETNEEDCFGNSFPTCGGCLWAQGIIQCP